MLTRVIAILAAGFALGRWDARRKRRQDDRSQNKPLVKPKEVTTWEGEGGALPVTGAQLGPAPAHH